MDRSLFDLRIIIRGGGEMATGTACRLYRAGLRRLAMTEVRHPLAVRRLVSFSEAVHAGRWTVEGITAVAVAAAAQVGDAWAQGLIPVLVDPENTSRNAIRPNVIIDAILAKRNLGTRLDDAGLVIGLGPGFEAGRDAHYVVETNRGHDLGRLIESGAAAPDTGIPGSIGGHSTARVIRASADGVFVSDLSIGAIVEAGDSVGRVEGASVRVDVAGVLRGLIRSGTPVSRGLKIGDVDPRANPSYCSTISEKARAIGGTVLEGILMWYTSVRRSTCG